VPVHWVKSWYASIWTLVVASLAGTAASAQQVTDPDTAAWEAAQSAGTYDAYHRYLQQFPVGRYAGEAFRLMVELAIDQELGGTRGLRATDFY
jgi:hypothetical protein